MSDNEPYQGSEVDNSIKTVIKTIKVGPDTQPAVKWPIITALAFVKYEDYTLAENTLERARSNLETYYRANKGPALDEKVYADLSQAIDMTNALIVLHKDGRVAKEYVEEQNMDEKLYFDMGMSDELTGAVVILFLGGQIPPDYFEST
ncbi:MAG: hypothetical protein GOV00_03050 [Candidatus Altiarchaeota archaeon]|nr:hypothetical protein [Candidatus Altiarchaeota archaeon]